MLTKVLYEVEKLKEEAMKATLSSVARECFPAKSKLEAYEQVISIIEDVISQKIEEWDLEKVLSNKLLATPVEHCIFLDGCLYQQVEDQKIIDKYVSIADTANFNKGYRKALENAMQWMCENGGRLNIDTETIVEFRRTLEEQQ